MHRFYLPPEQCQGPELTLEGPEAHHARDVLRVRPRDCVTVLDGVGHEFRCEIVGLAGKAVRLAVRERRNHQRPSGQVTLLQAVPKGKIMESIVQKATELGAFRIVPVLTERVVGKLDNRDALLKAAKWRQVAREAIKQCGAAWLPIIETPTTPAEFLGRGDSFEMPLIASLHGDSRRAGDYFQVFQADHKRLPASVAVWVGPEGDFTQEETNAIRGGGFLPITLGPLILRSETAAIYCLSVVSHELQPVGSAAPTCD